MDEQAFAAFDTELPQNIENKEGSAAEKIASNLKEKHMTQLLLVLKAVLSQIKGFSFKEGEIVQIKEYAERLAIELKKYLHY